MKNNFLKQLAIMAMAFILAVTMMPWNALAQTTAEGQVKAAEEEPQGGEDFEAQKEKVIGVLMMMVSFFAEEKQANVRSEIQSRISEMDGMTSIADVGRKANDILNDLIDKYPMKATTLDEWKAVVNEKILPVLDSDYFKESDKANVQKLREDLEAAIAGAETEEDVSAIQTALIQALVALMRCDVPSQQQILAISAVKAAYLAAVQEKEGGSTMIPSRFFGKLEEAYKKAVDNIKNAENEDKLEDYVTGFTALRDEMASAESDEKFKEEKNRVIGVLMMMVSFFAEDQQSKVEYEIIQRSAEMDGMTTIVEVAKKANEILNDLMAAYPMKATTLEEWKKVAGEDVLDVLQLDYFKEKDHEKLNEVRAIIEKAVKEATTNDDISSIKNALIRALVTLMATDFDIPEQYQILAFSQAKGLYLGAITKDDDGKYMIPEYMWDDLEEVYKKTLRNIHKAESREKAQECVDELWDVILWMRPSDDVSDMETAKKNALRLLRSLRRMYPSEDQDTIKAIIDEHREKINETKSYDEIWNVLLEANTALVNSGVNPIFDNLDQWKEWAKQIVAEISPSDYVVEDRSRVSRIISETQKSVDDAEDAKEIQMLLFGFAKHLTAARDLEGYRDLYIRDVDEISDRVCERLGSLSSSTMGDKASVRVAAEKVIRQILTSVSAKEISTAAFSLDDLGLEALRAWIIQSVNEVNPEKYVKEDREQLNKTISDIQKSVNDAESINGLTKALELYQTIINNKYTALRDAVNEAAITITDHAREAQANLTGDARSELIQSELDAIAKTKKLESKEELNAVVQEFDKKAGEIKAAAEKAAADKAAAEKAAADKSAADKAAAEKAAAAQKEAEKKFTVKGKKLKASSGKKKTISVKKAFKIKNAPSALTFKKTNKAGKGKIVVKKTGKVVVKKGLKKGTYKVKVRVTSKATTALKEITKNTVLKIKVK